MILIVGQYYSYWVKLTIVYSYELLLSEWEISLDAGISPYQVEAIKIWPGHWHGYDSTSTLG